MTDTFADPTLRAPLRDHAGGCEQGLREVVLARVRRYQTSKADDILFVL